MPGHIDLKSEEADLAALVARVRQGEEIVLTENGRAVARLSPPAAEPLEDAAAAAPPFGIWKDKGWIADDFDAPLPADLADAFTRWPKGDMPETP